MNSVEWLYIGEEQGEVELIVLGGFRGELESEKTFTFGTDAHADGLIGFEFLGFDNYEIRITNLTHPEQLVKECILMQSQL